VLGAALAGLAGPAGAADLKKDTALSLIPADAAFFSTNLRNKEQIDLVRKSNAFKKLMALPAVKEAHKQLEEQLHKKDGPAAMYGKVLQSKDFADALAVLKDAVSSEVFIYGGKTWVDLLKVVLEVNNAQQFGPLEALLGGGNPDKAMPRSMLRALDKNRKMLKVPELVLGFKVSDTKKAQAQLDKLQKILAMVLKDNELLKDKFKVTRVAGSSFLTLNLESTMIPWDQADLSEFEEKKGEFDDLMKHAKGLKAVVGLGLKGDYLLLSVTASTDDVAGLGKGSLLGEAAS